MKRRFTLGELLLAGGLMLFFSGVSGVAGDHEHVLKVGKTGEVTFERSTRVGDLTLAPGRYRFQHRVDGDDHYVHFTEWPRRNPYSGDMHGGPVDQPGTAKCRLEPLGRTAEETAVHMTREGERMRVTRILVKGENAAHLF
jgi:hypothetical protein